MTTRVVIIFPYGGLKTKINKAIFERIVSCSAAVTHGVPAILVIEEATKKRTEKKDSTYWEQLEGDGRLTIVTTWSVDTCQRWLTGWGYILDNFDNDTDRVVLLPADIERVGDIDLDLTPINYLPNNIDIEEKIANAISADIFQLDQSTISQLKLEHRNIINKYLENYQVFFQKISQFISLDLQNNQDLDFVIGDYASQQNSAKELIDTYGTFPLIANWFREVFRNITNNISEVDDPNNCGLKKPRSEFINIRKHILKELLTRYKPFPYEQTLNMIILWYIELKADVGIYKCTLGLLQDDKTFRKYRNCVDQIERTERMLKFIWREINEPKQVKFASYIYYQNAYHNFMKNYADHDRRSTAIRESANIALENFLLND